MKKVAIFLALLLAGAAVLGVCTSMALIGLGVNSEAATVILSFGVGYAWGTFLMLRIFG